MDFSLGILISGNIETISKRMAAISKNQIPYCLMGHSPPEHIASAKKFLAIQAQLTAAINTFHCLAHTRGTNVNTKKKNENTKCQ